MQEIWTIQKVLQWTTDHFKKHQVPDSRLSAELLLSHVVKSSRLDLYLQFERILTASELTRYRQYIQRRAKQEPVQYILEEQDFMGLTFRVTPEVLIPRPETEILVEKILEDMKTTRESGTKVLDVGTGSGAIAISLAHFRPDCQITAIDNSPGAIEIATGNAEKLGVKNVLFTVSDFQHFRSAEKERFDYIVSNPPYISETAFQELHPQVKNYEPRQALLGGRDGLEFYHNFLPHLSGLLNRNGKIFVEIGFDQRHAIEAIIKKSNFKEVIFITDYQNHDRIVQAKI